MQNHFISHKALYTCGPYYFYYGLFDLENEVLRLSESNLAQSLLKEPFYSVSYKIPLLLPHVTKYTVFPAWPQRSDQLAHRKRQLISFPFFPSALVFPWAMQFKGPKNSLNSLGKRNPWRRGYERKSWSEG